MWEITRHWQSVYNHLLRKGVSQLAWWHWLMTPDTWVTEAAGCKFKASLGVLVVVYCPDKYHNQKTNLGGEKGLFHIIAYIPLGRDVMAETQGRDLQAGSAAETMEECCLTRHLPNPFLFVCFLFIYIYILKLKYNIHFLPLSFTLSQLPKYINTTCSAHIMLTWMYMIPGLTTWHWRTNLELFFGEGCFSHSWIPYLPVVLCVGLGPWAFPNLSMFAGTATV